MLAEKATAQPSVCPRWGGSGWELVPGKGVRRCDCRGANRAQSLAATSRIPRRYNECTFESYFPLNPSQEAALMFARRVADEYPNLEIGLLFIGTCGVGKTHLAVA